MTTDPADPIAAYASAWRETDPKRRSGFLDVAWATDAVYCDPIDRVAGRDALGAHIEHTQAMLPGGRVEVTTEPVRHHDNAFFRWAMTDSEENTVLTGFDVVQFDASGRIARLTGFFDTDTQPPDKK